MRTVTKLGVLAFSVVMMVTGWSLRPEGARVAMEIASRVEVSTETPELLELALWAVGRFEASGLEAPIVEIAFEVDLAECGGHIGLARGGEVDICTTLVNAMTRRVLLHEMSHVWLDQNVTPSVRDRFLDLRGLRSWNASSDEWNSRGYEQGAEIIAWALGERILTAQVPDNEPAQLKVAFELLTGVGFARSRPVDAS
jgi:hypothetical protein